MNFSTGMIRLLENVFDSGNGLEQFKNQRHMETHQKKKLQHRRYVSNSRDVTIVDSS